MRNYRGPVLAGIGFLILLTSLVLGTPFTGFGAPPPPQSGPKDKMFDVFVVNPVDRPIPTQQQGVAEVMVSNTNPLMVREAALAARKPWAKWVLIDADKTDYLSVPVFTVPEGWVLHVEAINADGCLQDPSSRMTSNLTVWPKGYTADPSMPPDDRVIPKIKMLMSPQGLFRGMVHWGTNQQVNFFVEGGQAIWAEMYRMNTEGEGELRVWMTGYLVPAVQTGTPGW